MRITAQGPCLRNDLYCVEWDVKFYYTIPTANMMCQLHPFWVVVNKSVSEMTCTVSSGMLNSTILYYTVVAVVGKRHITSRAGTSDKSGGRSDAA